MKKENVLICVSNPANAEKLIEKGKRIANAFEGDCIALHVEREEYNELDYDHIIERRKLETISEKYEIEFLYVVDKIKKISNIITSTVKKNEISHIIIGQSVQSKWDIFSHGSLVNDLFKILDDVDLHVVEVSKENFMVEHNYEKGLCYYLTEDEKLSSYRTSEKDREGLFYKSISTDFQNGIFRIVEDKKEILYSVNEGEIAKKL